MRDDEVVGEAGDDIAHDGLVRIGRNITAHGSISVAWRVQGHRGRCVCASLCGEDFEKGENTIVPTIRKYKTTTVSLNSSGIPRHNAVRVGFGVAGGALLSPAEGACAMRDFDGGGDTAAAAGEVRNVRARSVPSTSGYSQIAFELVSSISLFIAGTFQAASQRPSLISALFLVLFGAERVFAGVASKNTGRGRDGDGVSTRDVHGTTVRNRNAVWRATFFLSLISIAGACATQILYAAFGPDWPHSSTHRLFLKATGFQWFPSVSECFSEITPFVLVLLVAATNVRLDRMGRSGNERKTSDGPSQELSDDELDLLPTLGSGAGSGDDGYTHDLAADARDDLFLSRDSRKTLFAIRTARTSALVAGVAAPSFPALPYFLFAVLNAVASAFVTLPELSRSDRNDGGMVRSTTGTRTATDTANSQNVTLRLFKKYKHYARATAVYAAAHFLLLYVYQLPYVNLNANETKARWLGLSVLFADTGGDAESILLVRIPFPKSHHCLPVHY